MPHNWKTYERRVALNLAELMIDCEVDAPDAMKLLEKVSPILAAYLGIPPNDFDYQVTTMCRAIYAPAATLSSTQENDAMIAARRAERALWLQMGS